MFMDILKLARSQNQLINVSMVIKLHHYWRFKVLNAGLLRTPSDTIELYIHRSVWCLFIIYFQIRIFLSLIFSFYIMLKL